MTEPIANDVGWGAMSALAGAFMAVAGLFGAWFRFGSGSSDLRGKAKAAEVKALAADSSAAAALGKCELLRRELSDLREKTSVDIARLETRLEMTAKSMTTAEERVADGLKDVSKELAQMSLRIDRALEMRSSNHT